MSSPYQDDAKRQRVPMVGETIIFHDGQNQPHNALVTTVWSNTCVNLVYVSKDTARTDSWGRQIERQSSCVHGSQQPAHGNYWRFSDEEPNVIQTPQQS